MQKANISIILLYTLPVGLRVVCSTKTGTGLSVVISPVTILGCVSTGDGLDTTWAPPKVLNVQTVNYHLSHTGETGFDDTQVNHPRITKGSYSLLFYPNTRFIIG